MLALRFLALLLMTVGLVAAAPAQAQLCAPTADPCVVTASVTVPGGTVIDLGARDLIIQAGRSITAAGTGTGSLSISAGRIEFQDSARIVAPGVAGFGGSVKLMASEAFVMAANSRVDVNAGSGGDIEIDAPSAVLNGQLRAIATAREGDGGFIDVTTTSGDITVGGGGIMATGGNGLGFGGFVFLLAANHLTIQALVEARGGEGGDIDIEAVAGNLTITPTGVVNNNATLESNDGGDISFASGSTIAIQGPVYSRGQGSLLEGGGFGGDLDIFGRNVTIAAQIELVGAGPDGDGGYLDVSAIEDISVSAPLLAMGAAEGVGGEVDLFAGDDIDVLTSIDVRGGFVGGTFDARATGTVTFASGAIINADFIPGFALGGYGGIVYVRGCDVTLLLGAALIVDGLGDAPRAASTLQASSVMTIGGTITANSQVLLRHRNGPPTILGSASITPAPTIMQDPTLPCCVGCPTTTTTSSSTTTSTVAPTTTTSISTTTSTVPLTTTSVSSSSTSSSSTSTSSSSTVTTVASSTTSTSLPLSCLDEPLVGYAAVECAVTHLQDMLAVQSEDALGGRKSAKRLAGKITKTSDLVEKSRTSPKAAKLLVKAGKKVVSFETQVAKLLARAKIEDGLATELLELAGQISVRIDGVLSPLAN